jgi:FKBP-type peptidyl-prolyl cis-trans isomerase
MVSDDSWLNEDLSDYYDEDDALTKDDGTDPSPAQLTPKVSPRKSDQARSWAARAWLEVQSTAGATFAHLRRWTGFVLSVFQLALLKRTLRRSQLQLGEEMYSSAAGDESIRDQVRKLEGEIESRQEENQSTRRLSIRRRDQVLRLASSVDSSEDPELATVAGRRVESLRDTIEAIKGDRSGKSEDPHKRTGPAIIRVATGYVVLALLLFVSLSGFGAFGESPDETVSETTADKQSAGDTPVAPFGMEHDIRLDEKKREAIDLGKQLAEPGLRLKAVERQNAELQKRLTQRDGEVAESKTRLERQVMSQKKRVVDQKRQLDTREQELKIAESQVTDLKTRLSEKARELAAAESRLQVANARISAANRKPRSPQPTARPVIVSKKTAAAKATPPSHDPADDGKVQTLLRLQSELRRLQAQVELPAGSLAKLKGEKRRYFDKRRREFLSQLTRGTQQEQVKTARALKAITLISKNRTVNLIPNSVMLDVGKLLNKFQDTELPPFGPATAEQKQLFELSGGKKGRIEFKSGRDIVGLILLSLEQDKGIPLSAANKRELSETAKDHVARIQKEQAGTRTRIKRLEDQVATLKAEIKGRRPSVASTTQPSQKKSAAKKPAAKGLVVRTPAAHSLGSKLKGYGGLGTFSADGKRVAACFRGREFGGKQKIKVWDVALGRELQVLDGHTGRITDVSFSPDGHLLASASSDKTAKIWDVATGKELLTLQHITSVMSVSFSPDGKRIATGTPDESTERRGVEGFDFLTLWDTKTGRRIRVLTAPEYWGDLVTFSPDGKRIASGSSGEAVKVWDATSTRLMVTLNDPLDKDPLVGALGLVDFQSLQGIAFSPNGNQLISDHGDGKLRVWDSISGKILLTLSHPFDNAADGRPRRRGVDHLSFSSDGSWIVVGGPLDSERVDVRKYKLFGGIRIWNAHSGEEFLTVDEIEHQVEGLWISPDRKRVVSVGQVQDSGQDGDLNPVGSVVSIAIKNSPSAGVQRKASESRSKLGVDFLAANARKEGVVTTKSGLQYTVLKAGKGATAKAADNVEVHYRGLLIDGTVFDESFKGKVPGKGDATVRFAANRVIKGWTEALQLMNVGAVYRLVIPSELAYGDRGAGQAIGPNAVLIFEVHLLNIRGPR